MSPERWQRLQDVFLEASELDEEARSAYLRTSCADDRELYDEVVSLLEASGGEQLIESAMQSVFKLAAGTQQASTPDVPVRFGPYRVIRELGEGGLATVYLAERDDEQFSMQVAVKVVKRGMDTRDIVRRLRQERQILARLDHPHIAKLLDGGTTDTGLPYFVMEHIEGEPIDEYCERRGLTTARRLELFRRACSAVHYAHQSLVIHRDIKPSNLLVTGDGLPKLLDFGIAKLLDPSVSPGTAGRTVAGVQLLTPEYASPEQVRGEALTTASDVYSLGVLLYRLLTGRQPYTVTSTRPDELRRAICETDPVRPGAVTDLGAFGDDLDNIVLMALNKEPQRRYVSVEQLSDDLDRYLKSLPVRARKDTLTYRCAKFARRHRGGVVAVAAVLSALVGGIIATAHQARIARAERSNALRHLQEAHLQSDRATQVSDFLVQLFRISDPSEARGNEVRAREILDAGSAKIRRELEEQPEPKALLMTTMGEVYRNLGLYGQALELFDEVLAHRRQGGGNAEIARSLTRVAEVRFEQGDYEVAEKQLRQALALQTLTLQRGLADEELDVSVTLDRLATVLDALGRAEEAERLFTEALTRRRRLLGDDHLAVAEVLNNLAELYSDQGNWAEAEALFRDVLERRRGQLGEDHPDVALSLHNLATVLATQEKREDAEPLYRQVLELRRKLFGEESADFAASLNNLAVTLQRLGRHGESVPLFRQALAVNRKRRGPESRVVITNMSNLATSLQALGESAEAESLFVEALALRRKVFGERHPGVALSLYKLALFKAENGRQDEAQSLFEQSLGIQREILPAGDFRISYPLFGLARLHCQRGEAATAEPLLREAVEIRHRAFQEDHRDRIEAEELLRSCF